MDTRSPNSGGVSIAVNKGVRCCAILTWQFLALQILEDLVKTQWKVLPPAQTDGSHYGGVLMKLGIKNFIVQQVIKLSGDYPTLHVSHSHVFC